MTIQLDEFQRKLQNSHIDCAFIDNPDYIAYFTGFESNPHERILALIVYHSNAFLFTPALEAEDAKAATDLPIVSYEDHQNPWAIIKENIAVLQPTVKFLGIDEDSLIVSRFHTLQAIFDQATIENITDSIQNIMVIKTENEIEKMKEAGHLADRAVEIGINALNEGITEQEVVAIIEFEMKKLGINEMSFPTMVLFGDHAGSPHGTPGKRKLKNNELVLFDLGVVKDGYTSDMTRTISFGNITEEFKHIYEVVLEAQTKAQHAIRPGMKASELDKIARDVISEAGYGEYFNHRLGHGLGKSIHEFPSISSANNMEIQEGMCFSIEPGIYIPGKIGIRIEDCIYVTKNGAESLTSTPKTFQTIEN